MKKFTKLVGIIAVAAVIGLFASCGEMGGTLEVKNSTIGPVTLVIVRAGVKFLNTELLGDTIPAGQTKTYTLDFDSDIQVTAAGAFTNPTRISFDETVNVSKGATVTLTMK
jgi:hypothetical protein